MNANAAAILSGVEDIRERLQPALVPGEQVLWSGQPDPSAIFAPIDALLIPFYTLWGVFAVFMTANLYSLGGGHGGGASLIFPIVFDAIGFYIVIGRFFVKAAGKRRTVYAVTDRRAIVIKGRQISESPVAYVQKTTKRSRDGSHITITFGPVTRGFLGYGRNIPNAGLDLFNFMYQQPVAFYDVADVGGLESAIARVSLAPTTPQSSPTDPGFPTSAGPSLDGWPRLK
jgi:hypothetical protein